MSLIRGGKADILKEQLSESVVLPAPFNITADFPSYEPAPPLSLLLPFAGNYAVVGSLTGEIEMSAGSNAGIFCVLVDTDASAIVLQSQRLIAYEPFANRRFFGSYNYWHFMSISKPTNIELQVTRDATTPTWVRSCLSSSSTNVSSLGYVQLIN